MFNFNRITHDLYYIGADDGLAAVSVNTNGLGLQYYAHADHQGSIVLLTDNASVEMLTF